MLSVMAKRLVFISIQKKIICFHLDRNANTKQKRADRQKLKKEIKGKSIKLLAIYWVGVQVVIYTDKFTWAQDWDGTGRDVTSNGYFPQIETSKHCQSGSGFKRLYVSEIRKTNVLESIIWPISIISNEGNQNFSSASAHPTM